jgi:hypothetical protein
MTNQQRKLDLDEKIAIIVSFSVIGAILTWTLTNPNNKFKIATFTEQSQVVTPTPRKPETQANPEVVVTQPREIPRQKASKDITPVIIPPTQRPEVKSNQVPMIITQTVPTLPPPVVETTPTPPPVVETTPTPPPVVGFLDVTQDYWAYPFISSLAAREIFKNLEGGNFNPNNLVTREEYAAFLTESFELNEKRAKIEFEDVDQASQEKEAIDNAVKAKFLSGYPGEVFEPNQPISKMQVLLSLASGLELPNPTDPETILQNNYQDWEEIPDYARGAIAAATESGLVVNYPDLKRLNPNSEVTRAEVTALVHQALVVRSKVSPLDSEYIIKGTSK